MRVGRRGFGRERRKAGGREAAQAIWLTATGPGGMRDGAREGGMEEADRDGGKGRDGGEGKDGGKTRDRGRRRGRMGGRKGRREYARQGRGQGG